MIEIHEDYVNRTKNARFGDTDWFEPYAQTRGRLFLELQKEYGRCEGRMYRDRRIVTGHSFVAFGVIMRPRETWTTDEVGWIFLKRMPYEDARRPLTEKDYYLREVWVEVRES